MTKIKIALTLATTCIILFFTYLTIEQVTIENYTNHASYYCRPIEFWCYVNPQGNRYSNYFIENTESGEIYVANPTDTYADYQKLANNPSTDGEQEVPNGYQTDFSSDITDDDRLYSHDGILINLSDKYRMLGSELISY